MKFKVIVFFLQYILVPAIIVPLISIKENSWFGMFGIGFYFIGLFISKFKQWIFLPIPFIFSLWYWYTYGFGIRDFVSIYFLCLLLGIFFNELKKKMDRFFSNDLPEKLNNLDFDAKVEELNRQIEKYKKEHPNEKVTQDLVEKLRTDIFFD